ncbi:MAG: response regulator [Lachnospiraceae bacterium]|nr:response regulator [Lachnospiraceae bacterium]
MIEFLLSHPEAHIEASVVMFNVILILFITIQSRTELREVAAFRGLVACGVLILLTDIIQAYMVDLPGTLFNYYLINIINMIDYLGILMLGFGVYFYFLFIYGITPRKWWKITTLLLFIIYVVILIVNLFNGCISLYSYETKTYEHGPLFVFIGNGIPIFAYALTIISFRFNYKKLNVRYRKAIAFVIIVIALGMVLQPLINAYISVTGLFASLGMFILYLTVETEDYRNLIEANDSLEEAKAKAQQANSDKSLFLANMSHEIRTPLNAYLGLNEMILAESKEEKTLEYARDMKIAGNALLSVVNDVLDISKIETGNIGLNNVPYHLTEVLEDIKVIITARAREKGLRFIMDVDESVPDHLLGDGSRLQQVYINILNNSVKYTEDGVVVFLLRGQRNGNELNLLAQITDTGIGIRPEDLEHLFERYQRVNLEKNKNVEGTGIGLSIVKAIVDQTGGEIKVTSNYGMGTVTFVSIPQVTLGEETVGTQKKLMRKKEKELASPIEVWEKSILIVDDNEMNLKVLKGLLSSSKARIVAEPGGEEALAVLRKKKFDIVLTDAFMPKVDGEAVLKEVKTDLNHLNYDTPFIVVTADALADSEEKYLAMGFDDYISKPVEMQRLKEVIKKFLPDAMGHIDKNKAMDNLSDEGLFKEVLENFSDTAEDKISHISSALDKENWKEYVIYVHGLKSNAKTIGAEELGELSQKLESIGKKLFDQKASTEEVETIKKETQTLLELYKQTADEAKKRVSCC